MRFRIKTSRVSYDIRLDGKYNFLRGNSGTGKSVLWRLLMLHESTPRAVEFSSDVCVYPVQLLDGENILTTHEGDLLVIDENAKILKNPGIWELLQESPNYFLIISREHIAPEGIGSQWELRTENGVTQNILIKDKFNQQYCTQHNVNLKIRSGITENTIKDVDSFFNVVYEDEWFNDSLIRSIVLDVDKSEVISGACINSPVMGKISPTKLSGGVKALILMLKTDEEIWATACGDNCSKWILEIAKRKELTIVLEHSLGFGE